MVRKTDCTNVIKLFDLNLILELDGGKIIVEVS